MRYDDSDPVRHAEFSGSDLVGVRWEEGNTCPACGEDTKPNERGCAFCPLCAERFKVVEQ